MLELLCKQEVARALTQSGSAREQCCVAIQIHATELFQNRYLRGSSTNIWGGIGAFFTVLGVSEHNCLLPSHFNRGLCWTPIRFFTALNSNHLNRSSTEVVLLVQQLCTLLQVCWKGAWAALCHSTICPPSFLWQRSTGERTDAILWHARTHAHIDTHTYGNLCSCNSSEVLRFGPSTKASWIVTFKLRGKDSVWTSSRFTITSLSSYSPIASIYCSVASSLLEHALPLHSALLRVRVKCLFHAVFFTLCLSAWTTCIYVHRSKSRAVTCSLWSGSW